MACIERSEFLRLLALGVSRTLTMLPNFLLCCLAQRQKSALPTADHVSFMCLVSPHINPLSSQTLFHANCRFHGAAMLLLHYPQTYSRKGVTMKRFSQLKSHKLTRDVMKHLIGIVEIQAGWAGVLTQWSFITPHPQRTTCPTCWVWEKHDDITVRKTPQIMLSERDIARRSF